MTDLTSDQLRLAQLAMRNAIEDTDRYIIGRHTTTPQPHDTCCTLHYDRWERQDRDQRALLARRKDQIDVLRWLNNMEVN